MLRPIVALALAAGLATTAGLGVSVGWAVFGPALTKTCPAPAMRPVGPEWSITGSVVGGLNGPGAILGSRVTWERVTTLTAPRRRLDVSLVSALDGEWGHQASTRGKSARVTGSDWPEPGSISVWWDDGGLGCTIYGVTLSGPAVTEAELLAAADALR
jgi:hypothetical protein